VQKRQETLCFIARVLTKYSETPEKATVNRAFNMYIQKFPERKELIDRAKRLI